MDEVILDDVLNKIDGLPVEEQKKVINEILEKNEMPEELLAPAAENTEAKTPADTSTADNKPENIDGVKEEKSPEKEDLLKLLEENKNREIELLKKEKEELLSEIEKVKKEKEEFEQKVKTVNKEKDDDDELVPDYIIELKREIQRLKENNTKVNVIDELKVKLSKIEKILNEESLKKGKIIEEQEKKIKQSSLFNEIRDLCKKYKYLSVESDIEDLDKEYSDFRKKVSVLINNDNEIEINRAINDIINKNGELYNKAVKYGIDVPKEYDKYFKIVNIILYKNGFKLENGEMKPILDKYGNQVRYKNLEEAYRALYWDEIINDSINSYKEKISLLENAPVEITEDATGYSSDELNLTEEQLLNLDVEEWKNPIIYKAISNIYKKYGKTPPAIKG